MILRQDPFSSLLLELTCSLNPERGQPRLRRNYSVSFRQTIVTRISKKSCSEKWSCLTGSNIGNAFVSFLELRVSKWPINH